MGQRRPGLQRAGFRRVGAAPSSGGLTQLTSTGNTVTITSPFGPVANLEVTPPAFLTTPNVAGLAAIDCTSLTVGTTWCYVATYRAWFALVTSTQPVIANVRVTPLNKAGALWLREIESQSWWSTLAWFVDPANSSGLASDENSGASALLPLATNAEQSRRFRGRNLPGAETNSYQVTLMSDAADTDYFQVHQGPNYRNANINATLQGTVKSIVAVGVIASAVAKNAAGNLANSITVTGFDFSTHIGQFVRLVGTSGTASVFSTIEAAPSLGVAQLSEQLSAGVLSAGFTATQTVEIPIMTKLPGATAEGAGVQLFIADCVLNAAGAVNITNTSGSVSLNRCEMRGGSTGSIQTAPTVGGVTSNGSAFTGRSYNLIGNFSPTCGAMINGQIILYGAPNRNHLASFGVQNGTVFANDGAIVRMNGDFHCFGLAAGAVGLDLRPGCAAYFAGAYYGSGNNAGAAGIRAFFDAEVLIDKTKATMDAGLGCYMDGGDGALSGGTAVAFAILPWPVGGASPSGRGTLVNG